MDHFLNIVRGQASQIDQGWAHPRIGIVTSVDAATFTARVHLQPEGVLSGWLPIASAWVGNGWGFACPPQPGDQVIVVCQEGDSEQGMIIGRLWSNTTLPPGAPAGECWLVHSSGTYIKLRNDGSISSGGGTWTHTGDLHVTGNVSDYHGSLATLRGHYDAHVHPPSNIPPSPID